jgi:hypothetical protein
MPNLLKSRLPNHRQDADVQAAIPAVAKGTLRSRSFDLPALI